MTIAKEILMIRPALFSFNEETAANNLYQNRPKDTIEEINRKALKEFDNFVKILENEGLIVNVIQDIANPHTPDSIFPNNWFSSHEKINIIYPMYCENRKKEVEKFLPQLISIEGKEIIDFRNGTNEVLESTGAMVLDRKNKIAYSSLSERANKSLFLQFCKLMDYEAIYFKSFQLGKEIYHTNVLMSITSDLAIICPELIEEQSREKVMNKLRKNHEIIDLSPQQILNFCANVLELEGKNGRFLLMSQTAYKSYTKSQLDTIRSYIPIVHIPIPTIEYIGGGSARCMVGEIY